MPGLILASRSPQRRAILEQLGVEFTVMAPGVEELTDGDPEAVAVKNAHRKAEAVASGQPGAAVVGVDTVVRIGTEMYDKPGDPEAARDTLEALSGRAHEVISGVCLIEAKCTQTVTESTTVRFRDLDPWLIDWYVSGGEWRERAGGYAIQGRGGALVRGIEGDYLNVVGLPVGRLLDLAPWLLGGPAASHFSSGFR